MRISRPDLRPLAMTAIAGCLLLATLAACSESSREEPVASDTMGDSQDDTAPDTNAGDTTDPADTDTTEPADTTTQDTPDDLDVPMTPQPDGAACTDDAGCESQNCATVWLHTQLSVQVCATDCDGFAACPQGHFCHVPGDLAGDCLRTCVQSCDSGEACVALPPTAAGQSDKACLPVDAATLGLGQACVEDTDCASGDCSTLIVADGEQTTVCLSPCHVGDPGCPAGASCFVPGDVSGLCLPDCTADDGCADATLSCQPMNAAGDAERRCFAAP